MDFNLWFWDLNNGAGSPVPYHPSPRALPKSKLPTEFPPPPPPVARALLCAWKIHLQGLGWIPEGNSREEQGRIFKAVEFFPSACSVGGVPACGMRFKVPSNQNLLGFCGNACQPFQSHPWGILWGHPSAPGLSGTIHGRFGSGFRNTPSSGGKSGVSPCLTCSPIHPSIHS